MNDIRVYRNINTVDKLFGLEIADGCALLFVFFTAFSLNREGLFSNGVILALVYFGLRMVKRGKPDGHILLLSRYALMSRLKDKPRFDECEPLGPLETK